MSRNDELFDRARRLMPGGVSSPVRAFGAVGGAPRVVASGTGARIVDVEGRSYLDFCGSWGALILGHAHPRVVEAMQRAIAGGSSFGAPTPGEADLAERIVDAFASIDRVRFTSSGTEAAMSAIRLARAATGRDLVVKTAGGYHGHADSMLVAAGSGSLTHGLPDSPGVPAAVAASTIVVAYNDADAIDEALDAYEVAAVVVEPVAANMGVVPPAPGYLERLRASTARAGAVLVFDEVVTGFRVAYGGVQTEAGVEPDLTLLGKVVGGGMPLAAYGGADSLMRLVAPEGPVYQAGTLSGNPVATAAGIATLDVLREQDPYPRLDALAARLAEGIGGDDVRVQRAGSMLTRFCTTNVVANLDDAKTSDTRAFATWFHRLLDAGVWWPPSQFEAAFVNAAMTDADIDAAIDAATS